MGAISSREPPDHDLQELNNYSYRFPPKNGSYFGSHFLMGGERFESSLPEAFLFGDNSDLGFLGRKPVQFPFPQSQGTEPIRTLQCLINVRRDSLKFVKAATNGDSDSSCPYNIEFTFDADVPCSILIHYFCTQVEDTTGVRHRSSKPNLSSAKYTFDIGAGQVFRAPEHVFDPSCYAEDLLTFSVETECIPVVIVCETQSPGQSQCTYAVVDKSNEGQGYVLKPLKQKLMMDGVCLLMQEMYGIENKNNALLADHDDNGADCVVCMSELRDTIIVPCRHLCLCNACAETLRYKANNCPICRSPFRALMQIKTMRRLAAVDSEPVTSRYEPVSLVEALNGPVDLTHTCVPLPTCSSAPVISGAMCGPPRAPPRGRLKKKAPRPVTSIQQVLTPQAIPSVPSVTPPSTPTSKQSAVAMPVIQYVEGGASRRSHSLDGESREPSKSSTSSLCSTNPLLPHSSSVHRLEC